MTNLKPIIMNQAVDFVKKQGQIISAQFTEEMHKLCRTFQQYRMLTDGEIDDKGLLLIKLRNLESMLAQKSPVNEAEYAWDERTPLILYDCLTPKVKEFRKFTSERGLVT